MGHAEDEVSLEISTKILSVPVLESFRVLVANCAVSGNYMLLVMSLFFPVVNIETVYIYVTQIKNSVFGLYKYFRVAFILSINWLKFAEVAL
jgi:hypothetical protein